MFICRKATLNRKFQHYHSDDHNERTARRSALEGIPGIGEARRKALLKAFGSVKGVSQAGLAELEAVVPRDAAQAVFLHFRESSTEKGEEKNG